MKNRDLAHDMELVLRYLHAHDEEGCAEADVLATLEKEGYLAQKKGEAPELTEAGTQMAHMLVEVYRAALETFQGDLVDSLARKLPLSNLPAFKFRITLELEGDRPCWREIVVPQAWTFLDLHEAIQSSLLWWGYHLYDFKFRSHGQNCMLYDPEQGGVDAMFAPDDRDYAAYDALAVRLDDVFPRTRKATYTYDYGDGWTHHIQYLESIDSYAGEMPVCTDGEGTAPPEDVGGAWGYENFLAVVEAKDDPGREDALAWARSQFWEPFDLEHVNERMRKWRSEELFDEWNKAHPLDGTY